MSRKCKNFFVVYTMSSRRSKTKTSIVWNYFYKSSNSKIAICNVCNKNMKFFGGTTNLLQHLLRIHPTLGLTLGASQLPEENEEKYSDIENNVETIFILPESSIRSSNSTSESEDAPLPRPSVNSDKTKSFSELQKKPKFEQLVSDIMETELSEAQIAAIDLKLLNMITKDFQPVSLVESKSFLELLHALQPSYKPPSMKQLMYEILPRHYTEAVSDLKSILSSVKHCAVSTDVWKSESNRTYVTTTSHFIYQDKRYARVLATEEMSGSHTAENVAELLRKTSKNWDITKKMVAVVSDKGASLKRAITKCVHPCIAHSFNLSVTDALSGIEELGEILEKCRTLTRHFKHNVKASETLKSVQVQMSLPIQKVKHDAARRWNSCFVMISRLVQIKEPLWYAVTNLPDAPEYLNADEWQIIDECIKVLEPANELVTILSSEKYPMVSMIIPLTRGFQFQVKNVDTETEVGERLKNNLLDNVMRRLGRCETSEIVAKACFLDPRFKQIAFSSEVNAKKAQELVTEELMQLITSKAPNDNFMELSPEPPACSTSGGSSEDLWAHFDSKVSKIATSLTPSTIVVSIIKQYLEVAPLERTRDPLAFWTKHKLLFPEMYELAMKYLCVPATSLPSERMFSKAGQLLNCMRNRLAPENLNYIVFLNDE